jgi:hypothetical protein
MWLCVCKCKGNPTSVDWHEATCQLRLLMVRTQPDYHAKLSPYCSWKREELHKLTTARPALGVLAAVAAAALLPLQ